MRTVGATLLILSVAFAAFGADQASAARKSKPPQPATPGEAQAGPPTADRATSGPLNAVYSAMSLADRISIQSDLIWTGDYNGVTDGVFSDRAVAAVKAFQKRNGGQDTGVLTPEERDKLAAAAQPRAERVGWQILDDQATGARIGLPHKLVPQASPGSAGSHWQSARGEMQVDTFRFGTNGTTLASVLEQQKKNQAGRIVEYSVVKPDFFVISGLQGGVKKFYVRAHTSNNEVRGIAILYDQAMEGIVDKVVIAMSSAFTPFPTAEIASEIRGSTPRKRKVEYASGIVVSPLGHILTDRRSVEECDFIVVPGGGNADRVAVDATSDVALLRIYGGDNLTPIAMASDSAGDSDVVLVGIADPQAQDGGNAVSTVHARLVAASARGRAIEPTPSMGFSGAAAVNGEGHFAGVVEIRPQVIAGPATSGAGTQAIVIPVEALHDFFAAQKLLPTGGHAGAQDPTRSIVRVICVRK